MFVNMCLDYINAGDKLSLSLVRSTIGLDVLGCCYTKKFYITLLGELVNLYNKNDSQPKEIETEKAKFQLLKIVMSRCCSKKGQSAVIEALKGLKFNENAEEQIQSLLKSKRIANVALHALEDDVSLFSNKPIIMRDFIEGKSVPALEYDAALTNLLIQQIAHHNCFISDKCDKVGKKDKKSKKIEDENKADLKPEVYQAILKRDGCLKNLLLWLQKHCDHNSELNEPQHMISCVLRTLDGPVSPQTESLVKDLLEFSFDNKMLNNYTCGPIIDWCSNTDHLPIAIMCLNNIDFEHNFHVINVISLIKLLKKLVRNDESFKESIDIISRIMNNVVDKKKDETDKDKMIIDYLHKSCPELAALISMKFYKYDSDNNPLRQPEITTTQKRIARQLKLNLATAVMPGH